MKTTDRFAAASTEADRYRILIEGISDYAIYMLDPDGRISSWNPGAQRMKGFAAADVLGTHFSRFYPPEAQAEGHPARNLQIAATEGRFEGEGWRIGKDDRPFWAHVIIDAIRSPEGDLVGFAKITRDLTERRESQLALEKAREALFQSQKMEAVGQLTGGIAHDFNNLLMAILGSLELVRKRLPYDPRITPLIENAMQGAQRGASLTQRMLAFARRQDLTLEAVDIGARVRGLIDLMQRSLGPTVGVDVRIPADLPPVLTDGNQLETALLNLAINARDAMPGGGTIVVSAGEEHLAEGNEYGLPIGGYVRLGVTDSGEGMSPETLLRAVDPFFTTKGVGKGTGLGLPMVHGVAEQSGGRLVLRSTPGVGTTAEIWLPLAVQGTPMATPAVDAVPADDGGRKTIVAVDDDALVLLNTVAMLEDLGHTVHEAYSGKDALGILRREQHVDLVITDQAMPGMTGVQLGEAILSEWPGVPVLIATGYAELPPNAPSFPRLAKPFSQKDLAGAIETAMLSPREAAR